MRILAIDYGKKRTGLAVTDPMQMIASGLTTVPTQELWKFLKEYTGREAVELFVLGKPKSLAGRATDGTAPAAECLRLLKKHFPGIPVLELDERFTSKMAFQTMIDSGLKKKQRQNKGLVDEISATILLQSYLQSL